MSEGMKSLPLQIVSITMIVLTLCTSWDEDRLSLIIGSASAVFVFTMLEL